MKIKLYILACWLLSGLVSCNDWLDVKPETEMTLEEMYADQQGFQDALTGAYLNMKSTGAYGQQLMYGTVEYLAQHWDCSANSTQEKISKQFRNDLHPALQNHSIGQYDFRANRCQTGRFRTGNVRDYQR